MVDVWVINNYFIARPAIKAGFLLHLKTFGVQEENWR
jgi:hypothetical protein